MKHSFLALAAAVLVASASIAAADAVVASSVVSGSMGTNGALKVAVAVASNTNNLVPASTNLPTGANVTLTFDSAKVTFVPSSVVGTAPYSFTPVYGPPTTVSGTVQKLEVSLFGVTGPLTGRLLEADFTVVDASASYAITISGVSGGGNDLVNVDGGTGTTFIPRTYDSTGTSFTFTSVTDWTILN